MSQQKTSIQKNYLHYRMPIFFSTLPPPPISTLFPYTTLFRSAFTLVFADQEMGRPVAGPPDVPAERLAALDRKSTRLNSSHVRISYAVFCLKKKKNYLYFYI